MTHLKCNPRAVHLWRSFFLITLGLGMLAASPPSGDVKPFYEDKTIRLIVPWPVGGGHDTNARTLARHLVKRIPGKPTIIIENRPGAGGMVGLNYVYRSGGRDGLAMVLAPSGALDQQLLGEPGVDFDLRKFHYLGSFGMTPFVLIVRKDTGVTSVEDLKRSQRPLIVGSSAPGSVTTVSAKALSVLLGIKIKLISGYKGIPPIVLAIERGELEAVVATYLHESAWRLVKEDIARPIPLQLGIRNYEPLQKKGWPLIIDLLKDPEAKALAKVIWGPESLSRGTLAMPPGVPADRVAILRAAYEKTVQDPEFLADAERLGYLVTPTKGTDLQEFISEFLATAPELVEKYKKLLK